jgi:hypothetical protein
MLRLKVRYAFNKGHYVWAYEDIRARSLYEMANKLKEAGLPDQPIEVYQRRRLVRSIWSFYHLANRTAPLYLSYRYHTPQYP